MRTLLLGSLLLSQTLSTADTTLNACAAAPNDCSLRGAIALMSGASDLRFGRAESAENFLATFAPPKLRVTSSSWR
jgi:hypothetical protein